MAAENSGKIMMFGVLLLLGLGIFYLGSLTGKGSVVVNTAAAPVEHAISVSGEAEKKVSPDQLVLRFSVETTDMDAPVSESRNAEIVNAIKAKLLAIGITEGEIATDYYSMYPEYETVYVEPAKDSRQIIVYPYPITEQGNLTGYKTTHSITVKTGQLQSSGQIVSAVAGAGATSITEVTFGLKKETRKAIEVELLSLAAADAKDKAARLAFGVDGSLGKTISISSGRVSFPSYYKNYATDYAAMAEGGASSPATEIFPEEMTITSSVSASFEIVDGRPVLTDSLG